MSEAMLIPLIVATGFFAFGIVPLLVNKMMVRLDEDSDREPLRQQVEAVEAKRRLRARPPKYDYRKDLK